MIVGERQNQRIAVGADVKVSAGQIISKERSVHGKFTCVEIDDATGSSSDGPIVICIRVEIGQVVNLAVGERFQANRERICICRGDIQLSVRLQKIPV